MNTIEAHAVREALFTSRLPVADAPELFRQVYERLPQEQQEIIYQAADMIRERVKGCGMGGALELLAKCGALMVELEKP